MIAVVSVGQNGVVICEVISVLVINESVVVVIYSGNSVNLRRIIPDGIFKIRMLDCNSLIKDCHDNSRVTGSQSPCVLDIDVCTSNSSLSDSSAIYHIPLIFQIEVIERQIW